MLGTITSESGTVTKCAKELRNKYRDAKYKYDVLNLNGEVQKEFDEVQARVMKMVKDVWDCTARLEKISLKMNPMSMADYIDLQLKTEQIQAEPGWQWRVKQLQKLKQQAEYKVKITHNNYQKNIKSNKILVPHFYPTWSGLKKMTTNTDTLR